MALLASGVTAIGRQVIQSLAPDNTTALYLPGIPQSEVTRVGGIELLRRVTEAPAEWAQEVFIPIYTHFTRINLPSGAVTTNYRIGAIWYVQGLTWELYD